MGGCGAKFVHLLESSFNTIVNLSNKSSRWDTCAGQAIITSMGGLVCTLQGTEILYDHSGSFTNDKGFLCVMNTQLLPEIIAITHDFEFEI